MTYVSSTISMEQDNEVVNGKTFLPFKRLGKRKSCLRILVCLASQIIWPNMCFNLHLRDGKHKFLKSKYTKYVYSTHTTVEFHLCLILIRMGKHINVLKVMKVSACTLGGILTENSENLLSEAHILIFSRLTVFNLKYCSVLNICKLNMTSFIGIFQVTFQGKGLRNCC